MVSASYKGTVSLQFAAQSGGLLSYLHDLSEPIPGVTVENSILEHLRIPAADGTLLDTWLLRPNIADAVPVILEVTPYYGGGSPYDPENLLAGNFRNVAARFVPRGELQPLSKPEPLRGLFCLALPTSGKRIAILSNT